MRTRALMAAVLVAIPVAALAQEKFEGYTCCNLHYDKDWISDANWGNAAMIPAGSRIRVVDYTWAHANVEIDGRPYRMGQDYGKKEESLDKYLSKIVVKTDPRPRIEQFPAPVKTAIHEGRVIPGMTREQVLMAVGYPPTHKTPSLDAPVWNHWLSRAGRYELHWRDGKVERVAGSQR